MKNFITGKKLIEMVQDLEKYDTLNLYNTKKIGEINENQVYYLKFKKSLEITDFYKNVVLKFDIKISDSLILCYFNNID